jgi:hypothetical protein
MRADTLLTTLITLAGIILISGCTKAGDPASDASPAPAAEEAAATTEMPSAVAEPASLPRTSSPQGAGVFFISPADGDTVTSPVTVEFGITNMNVVKAGEMAADSGHHHLLIDTGLPNPDMPIPADAQHRHFGDASTSTELTLEPGQHTLQLIFADYLHIPHNPPVYSETITITVE